MLGRAIVVYAYLRRIEIWVLLLASLAWFDSSSDGGFARFILAVIPASMMMTTALGTLFLPGDRRLNHVGALGGLIGLVYSILMLLFAPGSALVLAVLSIAGIVSCGALAMDDEPVPEGLPDLERTLRTGAELGIDEVVLGAMFTSMGVFANGGQARVAQETSAALEVFADKGWLESPTRFHAAPDKLDDAEVRIRKRSIVGWSFEEMEFESGYQPWPDVPGRERYLSYRNCRQAHAWLLRGKPEAPWVICVHGLGMGEPLLDLNFLHGRLLHREMGLNLVFPVLPMHGPRKKGLISGRGIATGELLDTVHAQAQAVWDIRRLILWVRAQGAEKLAMQGMSLGGYNTALVSCFEGGLDCAIAGIPAPDLASLMWWHAPTSVIREAEREGLTLEQAERVLTVVSPLAMKPVVAIEKRFIYGALGDRFVPPAEVQRLATHWGLDKVHWYPGSHLSFPFHKDVSDFIASAMKNTVLAGSAED
jgi:pimeloyl-ACP methyl ester carboxylesterase